MLLVLTAYSLFATTILMLKVNRRDGRTRYWTYTGRAFSELRDRDAAHGVRDILLFHARVPLHSVREPGPKQERR